MLTDRTTMPVPSLPDDTEVRSRNRLVTPSFTNRRSATDSALISSVSSLRVIPKL
jgi:hypothetical protein